ncbi:hypothetical protein [Sutcliffiella horikoshii]|uniref:hypothetical protein n=1 Tax=Sutcliffiella horikoshii TaxID=79883 RepID=UPI003CEAA6F2
MKPSEILHELGSALEKAESRKELVSTLNRYSSQLEKEKRRLIGLEREVMEEILRFLGLAKLEILQKRDPDNDFMRKIHEKIMRIRGEG